jgi:hypothetical protein
MVVLLGAMNQIPLYDDKAYLNNALVFGGRISKTAVQGPFAEERPPLLWWTLASLLAMRVNLFVVNLLVPFYGLILMLAAFILAYEITSDLRIAVFSTILLGFNSFFLVFSSLLLSDIPGAGLATVFMLCLYVGIVKQKKNYLIIAGPLLALNIIMRDQNLILIPIGLFFCILSLRTKRINKVLLMLATTCALAIPTASYGLIVTLQALSALLTPVIIGAPYKTPLTSVAISYFIMYLIVITFFSFYAFIAITNSHTSERKKQYATLALSGELFTLMIYPYLWDNFRLGAEFQIAGKGILARLIAHDIMAVTVGQGMNLTAGQRLSWWITGIPFMLTPTLLALSILGIVLLIKIREQESLNLLLPWFIITLAFTLWQSQIEARYLAPSLPPLVIFAGVGARWLELRLKRYFNKIVLPIILLSENLVMHGLSINLTWINPLVVNAFDYFITQPTGWWSSYMRTIRSGNGASVMLDPLYCLVAMIGIATPAIILFGHLSSIRQSSINYQGSSISNKIRTLTWRTPKPFLSKKLLGISNGLTCDYCGRQFSRGSRYCDKCGRPLSQ